MSWKLVSIVFLAGCIAVRAWRSRLVPLLRPAVAITPPLQGPGQSVAGLTTPELALVLAQRIKDDDATAKRHAEGEALLKSLSDALKPRDPEAPKA